jgi:hypothetical protein
MKTREIVAKIQLNQRKLAAGEVATDPLTNRSVTRPELSEEEQEVYWYLQHFGPWCYPRVLGASGGIDGLITRAALKTLICAFISGSLGVWALSTLSLVVTSPRESIVVTLAVISAVFSLCWTYVCIAGWLDVKKLQRVDPILLAKLVQKLQACSWEDGILRTLPSPGDGRHSSTESTAGGSKV